MSTDDLTNSNGTFSAEIDLKVPELIGPASAQVVDSIGWRVLLVMQNEPARKMEMSELDLPPFGIAPESSHFDPELFLSE